MFESRGHNFKLLAVQTLRALIQSIGVFKFQVTYKNLENIEGSQRQPYFKRINFTSFDGDILSCSAAAIDKLPLQALNKQDKPYSQNE